MTPFWTRNSIPSTVVWYGAPPVTVPDGRLPEVEVVLTVAEEANAELDPTDPEDEPLRIEELEPALPVMVVPGSVVVGPGT